MTDRPLVSICIPAYNAERWLAEALDSALGQTFADFELIVADNGSTDTTAELALGYDDPRIRVERRAQPIGAVANHNRAVRLSRGEFVKFLHADDLLRPDCVEQMVGLAREDPDVALVFAPRDVLLEPGFEPQWAERFARPHENFDSLGRINDGRRLFRALLASGFEGNWIGEPSAILLRREPLERAGLFNERLFQIADLELWARLAVDHKLGFIDRVLSVYRHHDESGTAANARVGRDWLDKLWLFESLLEIPDLTEDERARLESLRRAAFRQAVRSQVRRLQRRRWSADLAVYAAARLRGTPARVTDGTPAPPSPSPARATIDRAPR